MHGQPYFWHCWELGGGGSQMRTKTAITVRGILTFPILSKNVLSVVLFLQVFNNIFYNSATLRSFFPFPKNKKSMAKAFWSLIAFWIIGVHLVLHSRDTESDNGGLRAWASCSCKHCRGRIGSSDWQSPLSWLTKNWAISGHVIVQLSGLLPEGDSWSITPMLQP